MARLTKDLIHSIRTLLRSPGASFIIVLSLGLGIGANTAIFNIAKAAFFDTFSTFEEPERLISIFGTDTQHPGLLPLSFPNLEDMAQSDAVESLAAYQWFRLNLLGGDRPDRVFVQLVSGNYFQVLGARALHGRTLSGVDDDLSAPPAIVLSHGFWTRRFASDPNIVGKTLTLSGHQVTVVGVMVDWFKGTATFNGPDVWVPTSMYDRIRPPGYGLIDDRRERMFEAVARLAPGVEMSQAEAALELISKRLAEQYPEINGNRSIVVMPLLEASINPQQRDLFVRGSQMLLAVTGILMLIACTNMAGMLLAQAFNRRRETAIRLSIGASLRDLLRRYLTESLVLTLVGGLLGLLVAYFGPRFLWRFRPSFVTADALDLGLDLGILGFAFGISLLTGLLFGLPPALSASRVELVSQLKAEPNLSGERTRWYSWRNLLISVQIALCVIALVGGGLFLKSWNNARQMDLGFDDDDIVIMTFDLGQDYDPERGRAFFRNARERIETLPGVEQVAFSSNRPLNRGAAYRTVEGLGESADEAPNVRTNVVSAGYFETLGISLVRGRTFAESDREDARPVVVINEKMKETFWPDDDVIGKVFTLGPSQLDVEIVGVVENGKYIQINEDPQPCLFLPQEQDYRSGATLYAATSVDARTMVETVRREIQTFDERLPMSEVRTLAEEVDRRLWAPRLGAVMLTAFAVLAFILAISGTYGIVSYSVSRRARELSIRLSLGARHGQVLAQVLRQTMVPVILGIAVGLGVSLMIMRVFSSFLFNVGAGDPWTYIVIGLVLSAISLLAGYLPARRILRISPAMVLR